MPLSFDPGEAYQVSWSHEVMVMAGVTTTVKVIHALPQPDVLRSGLGGGDVAKMLPELAGVVALDGRFLVVCVTLDRWRLRDTLPLPTAVQ